VSIRWTVSTSLATICGRRRPVGIAHAEVDDVLAAAASLHLELGGDVEYVRGKALDAGELRLRRGGHGSLP
jgi:hypothetical protein